MKEILKAIFEKTSEYYGTATFLVMAVFIGVLLMFLDWKKYSRVIIPVLMSLFVILNPVCYKIIFCKIRFWRLFWMIPMVYIILMGFMELIRRCDTQWKKVISLVGLIALLAVGGDNVFADSGLGIAEDSYKLPHGVVQACDAMLKTDKTPRCVVGGDLRTAVRLYSGEIEPMYGRDTENYIDKASEYEKKIYKQMESENPDYAYILSNARRLKYNFVVNTYDKPIDYETMTAYGYKLISDKGGYNVYYNPDVPESSSNESSGYTWKSNGTGWYCLDASGNRLKNTNAEIDGVWYYFNNKGFLMESMDSKSAETINSTDLILTAYGSPDKTPDFITLDDQQGNLVIINGGAKNDYKAVHDVLKMYGRNVTAWILTDDNDESAGAFNKIYKNFVKETSEGESDAHPVQIGNIYVPEEFSNEKFEEVTEGTDTVVRVPADEEVHIGGISIYMGETSEGKTDIIVSGQHEGVMISDRIMNITTSDSENQYPNCTENGTSMVLH